MYREKLERFRKIFSVSEITFYINSLLENDEILQRVLVKGEISNFRKRDNRIYFSLKDESSIIECVMFNYNETLRSKLKDGMQVIVEGSVRVYKKRGIYQIIVEGIELLGKGLLFLKFLELKEKLEKEGLFKEEFKKPLPKFPKKIGVVTSLEGAAIKDILNVLERRFPLQVIIYHSSVQGENAKETIIKGIKKLNEICVDVIIVARGGGSFEDLAVFNDEEIARCVFSSKVPVVSAIGHETDFTIIDFVADKRAPTPSAAAELVVPDKKDLYFYLSNLREQLKKNFMKTLKLYKEILESIKNKRVMKNPLIIIEEYQQALDEKYYKVKQEFLKFELIKKEIESLQKRLENLDPQKILKRGYCIVMKKNEVIESVRYINEGDLFSVVFGDGKINAIAKETIKNE